MKYWIIINIALMLSVIFLAVMLYSHKPLSVVILDQDRLIATFVNQLSAHTFSSSVLKSKTDMFRDAMKNSIALYASKNNVLVLDKKYTLTGGLDITKLIEHDISLRMRGIK